MSYNTNITNARKDLYKLAELAIETGLEININTKKGNVVLISEDDYRGLLETIYLSQNKEYKETLIEGLKADVEKGIKEKDVDW
ncbi:MAG: type II toxin-antitoxin system Phd/YefM family antitoxin [Acholeplasmatales bacterium]|jgi:PHD/YefM family antitoxin component YafN of YafNO toxin-antitoxin module|nr:type II toxin-antitoxin system Phd/YefM family antitoxin [Acholeplasmataceae bacterium]MCK9289855.1 type II toxin-antitoxin system Phd/YefM family antitoxin [Acholeplasmataceae bacterium]MCK9428280.1 type II toxin-antitoxin system Phd/YefM family antitoxin [Acholeplasmataceae bacterium]MDY0114865.1 type II toxin-antitoxin system Phd/YefM family antitoxin [Acholeplasmatales bacterium]